MDGELERKLEGLLNSPQGLAKIEQMMAALGGSLPASEPSAPPVPTPSSSPAAPDLSALLKLAPLLSELGADDHHTALLKALRPYLHGDREKRLDESVKLLQLLKLLPILREGGALL